MPASSNRLLSNQSLFTIKRRILTLAVALFLTPACIPKDHQGTHLPPKQGVPSMFIAVSETRMGWEEAKAFCEQHGGRLPRINNNDSWPSDGRNTAPIDGFGNLDDPWPTGLPSDDYWTGTWISDGPDCWWVVNAHGGKVNVDCDWQRRISNAVCFR